jgi:hypothetical protein
MNNIKRVPEKNAVLGMDRYGKFAFVNSSRPITP